MSENELREKIACLVDPGSMTMDTVLDELADDYSKREIQVELVDMITEGVLEEHPEFNGVYRVTE